MKLKYSQKLILLLGFTFFVSFGLVAIFTIRNTFRVLNSSVETNLYNVALIVSEDETVKTLLEQKDFSLNDYINFKYDDVKNISYIVVIDLDSIRYSHPDASKVGLEFVGGDEDDVIDNGLTYFSESVGTLGSSKRIFIPITLDDVQIGAVSVGSLQSDIFSVKLRQATLILLGFGIGAIVSSLGLVALSKQFTSKLLGFHPEEIAMLYSENMSVIEQLSEAIISVDKSFRITTLNKQAKSMFHLTDDDLSKQVSSVFPYIDFENIMLNNKQVYNKLLVIDNEKLLVSSFPLYSNNNIIGATAIFRSRLEVDILMDQISGYQKISKALRAQKHEFQNKMHVILGLIQMKDYETVNNYITQNINTTNLASDYYTSRIKDDRITALFVGKEIQSKEYETQITLTSESKLSNQHNPINSDDMVVILGNLIDNSFEAYQNKNIDNKRIIVQINESEDEILIGVTDFAGGIDKGIESTMFKRGVSTKEGDYRGTGLSLVNEIIKLYSGRKTVINSTEKTYIEVILSKVKI